MRRRDKGFSQGWGQIAAPLQLSINILQIGNIYKELKHNIHMEIEYSETIKFERELSKLDKFVIEFTKILNKHNIKYVLVSGYVSILFGRNRTSEDVDLIVEKINFRKFKELWNELYVKFECLNTENIKQAYEEYLLNNISIRFSMKKIYVPNMEIKFPKTDLDKWTVEYKKEVKVNNNLLFISPIELQIAFKLFLGSKKDIEDAHYLYRIFKDKINQKLFKRFNRQLNIEGVFNKYLK